MKRSIREALQHWLEEGLLTAGQVDALAASYETRRPQRDSGRAVMIFGVIGAVLTGLGVILFVASNWAGMSPVQRTALLLAAYAAVVAAAVLVERRGLPMVAEAVWLLATIVLGANIFLIGQTYNLALTLWQGTLAWTVGALALGYARRSRAQAEVAVPLAILTIGWAGGGSGWFFDDQFEFLFSDGGLRPVLPLLGLALVAVSALVVKRDDIRFAQVPCFRWGTFLVAATLIVTTVTADLAAEFYRADFSRQQVVLMITAAALVAAAATWGRFASRASRPAILGLLVFLATLLIPVRDPAGTNDGPGWVGLEIGGMHALFALYVVAIFAAALYAIWLGIRARNPRLVNVGMVSTTLLIVIQYFGWSFQLLDRSLAFILGGILLIALSVFVEKRRRAIMEQIA